MPQSSTSSDNPGIVIRDETFQVPFVTGDMPGSSNSNEDSIFDMNLEIPPVNQRRVLQAMLRSGAVTAVGHAIAQGTTGMGHDIVARFDANAPRDRWPDGAEDEHDRLTVFLATGYRGEEVTSIREGLYNAEHDRFAIGWGGVTVFRDDKGKPIAIGAFEALGAKFSKPDPKPVMTKIPVATDDGRIIWTEVPRHFRRILVIDHTTGARTWYKQYGDPRVLDSRTGRYVTKVTKSVVPAVEVMSWATRFPGVGPYGVSGWHTELAAVDSAKEHIDLLLSYLRSGLHSVVIAAADRPFESATADAAVDKIDKLGRGREGLAALITIALSPTPSGNSNPLADSSSADRGRLVLHELHTKLPEALTNEVLSDALTLRIAQSERLPELLIGRSGSYNFATAAAAWSTANRLRFSPHHAQKDDFLNAVIIEMGIRHWSLRTISPDWKDEEPLNGMMSVSGQLGGVTVNTAMKLMYDLMDMKAKPIDAWWGSLPFPLVTKILEAPDPQAMASTLGITLPNNAKTEVLNDVARMMADVASRRA